MLVESSLITGAVCVEDCDTDDVVSAVAPSVVNIAMLVVSSFAVVDKDVVSSFDSCGTDME